MITYHNRAQFPVIRNNRYWAVTGLRLLAALVLAVGVFVGLLTSVSQPRLVYAANYNVGNYTYLHELSSPACFATIDGTDVYSSTDASAVQNAVDVVSAGGTVKVAGYCAGVQTRNSTVQTVYISQALTLRGGYTNTDWSTYNPAANPTTLDALGGGRVIYASVDATLQGFTVTNGFDANGGGGITTDGAMTLTDMTVYSNTAVTCGGAGFNSIAALTNVTFTGNTAGYAGGGACFWGVSTAALNVTFTGNTAAFIGGGAYFQSAAALTGVTFMSNMAAAAGGAYFEAATTLTGTTFISNTALSAGGGGAGFNGAATLTDTTFIANTADTGGGAYFQGNNANQLSNVLLVRNTAATNGAAVYMADAASLSIMHTTIASPTLGGNQAVYVAGGTVYLTNTIVASHTIGIENAGGTVSEDYSLFYDNTTNLNGVTGGSHSLTGNPAFVNSAADDYHLTAASAVIDAGVNAGVTTDLDGVTRPQGAGYDIGAYEYEPPSLVVDNLGDGNDGDYGPGQNTFREAIANANPGDIVTFSTTLAGGTIVLGGSELGINKQLTISGTVPITVSGNNLSRVFNIGASGVVTLSHLNIVNGTAGEGGGILNSGTLTLNNSTVSDNRANNVGGGIRNDGTLTLNNSTISDNTSTYQGGGIFNTADQSATLNNCTVSDNESSDDDGGGIYSEGGSELILARSLIAGNTANFGREIGNDGTTTSTGYNLFGHNGESSGSAFWGFTPGTGDILATSDGAMPTTLAAILGPLADNGGGTWTHALVAGSPAIDAGDPAACPATDQRGELRNDWRCDIGAFELRLDDSVSVTKAVTGPGTYTFGPTLVKLEIASGETGTLSSVTVTRTLGDHPGRTGTSGNHGVGWGEYWTLTPNSGATFTVSLTLPTLFAPNANSKVCRFTSGTTWDCMVGISSTVPFTTITRSGVTGFSDWAAGNNVGPLAVTLKDFTAMANAPVGVIGALAASLAVLGALSVGRRVRGERPV
jgi:hypothetical protein